MTTLVVVLRVMSVLTFVAPMSFMSTGRRVTVHFPARPIGDRRPLLTNLAAGGAYVLTLMMFSGTTAGSAAVLFASLGFLLVVAGAALVVRARSELGPAWSLVPKADEDTGLVTTGPYGVVRHPIYLGFVLLAAGEALAFGSWPALVVVLAGLVPTFAWRAIVEERALIRTFGTRYTAYHRRTRRIVPYVL